MNRLVFMLAGWCLLVAGALLVVVSIRTDSLALTVAGSALAILARLVAFYVPDPIPARRGLERSMVAELFRLEGFQRAV